MTKHLQLAGYLLLIPVLTLAQASPTNEVPVIDAGLGSCTADVRVMDSSHHPIYKAEISTRIRYGFAGLHKIDLQIGTNVDGKARFTGLPEQPRETLQFTAEYNGRSNTVLLDPEKGCHASVDVFITDKPVETGANK